MKYNSNNNNNKVQCTVVTITLVYDIHSMRYTIYVNGMCMWGRESYTRPPIVVSE